MVTQASGPGARAMIAATLALVAAAIWSMPSVAPAMAPVQTGADVRELAVVLPRADCAHLARADLAVIGGVGSRISGAAESASAQGQPVCVVEGVLAQAIRFRVELPLRGWTQRYLQTGCGGLCGHLDLRVGAADGCPVLRAGGFVVASTDMGHQDRGGAFGRDPQKRADFAYRGVHLTALAAKALTAAFYGQPPRWSYFSGCSDGGREALVEAQRFPTDFDGILAGAPAMNFVVQNSLYHGWQADSNTGADGRAILLAGRLPILHDAVLAACDRLDGLTDGIVSMPGSCRFDPRSIVCREDQTPATCLTTDEAAVAQRFYDGPRDPTTGERLTQGGPRFGSELQWAGVFVPAAADQPTFSKRIAEDAMPDLIFASGHPATVGDIVFDRATFDRAAERHTLFDATNPDLSAFAGRGGRLILYHGWADQHISPLNTIAYHDAVRHRLGGARADGFERLYLMPGMGHCSGGEGPSAFDLLTPLMAWVERGTAPDAVETRTPAREAGPAGRAGGAASGASATGPARMRPVYPYPYIAAYAGKGDAGAAVNWIRGPARPVSIPTWAGSRFYGPYVGVTG